MLSQYPPAPDWLRGTWNEKNWLNVPGPIYGAETDTCCTGAVVAPANVLYDGRGQEFVWKQPQNSVELNCVIEAAWNDPLGGYNVDGDDHWTHELVTEWWLDRRQIRQWITDAVAASPVRAQGASQAGLSDDVTPIALNYADYLASQELEHYLRRYLFLLQERRAPGMNDSLPGLPPAESTWRKRPQLGSGIDGNKLPAAVKAVNTADLIGLQTEAREYGMNQRLVPKLVSRIAAPDGTHYLMPILVHRLDHRPEISPHWRCFALLTTSTGEQVLSLLDMLPETFDAIPHTMSRRQQRAARDVFQGGTVRSVREWIHDNPDATSGP